MMSIDIFRVSAGCASKQPDCFSFDLTSAEYTGGRLCDFVDAYADEGGSLKTSIEPRSQKKVRGGAVCLFGRSIWRVGYMYVGPSDEKGPGYSDDKSSIGVGE
jgi:hypothetical protein